MASLLTQLQKDFKQAKKFMCGKRKFPWIELVHNALSEKVTLGDPRTYLANVFLDIVQDGYKCLTTVSRKPSAAARAHQLLDNKDCLEPADTATPQPAANKLKHTKT